MNPVISFNFVDYLIHGAYVLITIVVGYLLKKHMYNEGTRGLNAISFAILTPLMSGISMYAMALLFEQALG